MECSICGSTKNTVTTHINLSEKKTSYVCFECSAKKIAHSFEDLSALDEQLKATEELCEDLEKMIKRSPKMPEIPEGLEAFAFTPMKIYEATQAIVASLKTRRLELLTSIGSETRLLYDLGVSLEKEEYEKAAEIQKELDALKSK